MLFGHFSRALGVRESILGFKKEIFEYFCVVLKIFWILLKSQQLAQYLQHRRWLVWWDWGLELLLFSRGNVLVVCYKRGQLMLVQDLTFGNTGYFIIGLMWILISCPPLKGWCMAALCYGTKIIQSQVLYEHKLTHFITHHKIFSPTKQQQFQPPIPP